MRITEVLLARAAQALLGTEVAHSKEMKAAVASQEGYDAIRPMELQRVLSAARKYHVPIAGCRVLDFGCADGLISRGYLSAGAASVVGVDIDAPAVARARARFCEARLTFNVCGVSSIPLEDESVDTVISYDVFEHVERPLLTLRELFRVAKPGGSVLIGTWGWRHPFAPHLWSVMPVPWAHLVVSERTLLRACRRVYSSDSYVPTRHDLDEYGNKKPGKYLHTSIPRSYLNRYLISDFERDFLVAGFQLESNLAPFGSRLASWTRPLVHVRWLREFVTGYAWFVLRRSSA
jgi:2-polyprenyl-3-methyl-5-hydroxy-6-metoxy-1,4-benzoquinol methylase